jgi:hypothetical protein
MNGKTTIRMPSYGDETIADKETNQIRFKQSNKQ